MIIYIKMIEKNEEQRQRYTKVSKEG